MSVYTKQSEVEVGQVWEVRWHDGTLTEVRIDIIGGKPIRRYNAGRGYETIGRGTRYHATNLKTGRRIVIKSAAKLRRRVR
jgi:hypothetical protein